MTTNTISSNDLRSLLDQGWSVDSKTLLRKVNNEDDVYDLSLSRQKTKCESNLDRASSFCTCASLLPLSLISTPLFLGLPLWTLVDGSVYCVKWLSSSSTDRPEKLCGTMADACCELPEDVCPVTNKIIDVWSKVNTPVCDNVDLVFGCKDHDKTKKRTIQVKQHVFNEVITSQPTIYTERSNLIRASETF